jgi:RNA polymerase sigma-70 factor (ECF subfamily)
MMSGWEMALTESEACAAEDAPATVRLSFEDAFTMHHRAVYRYACAMARDAHLAEDVVQEVFLRLYQHLEAAQRDGLLRAWLLRVTRNVLSNMLRSKGRAVARDEEFASAWMRSTTGESPDEEVLRKDEINKARRALNRITEPMRSCLLLRHEGLSYREIAVAIEVSESSVGNLIARGRREFIRLYGKIGGNRQ